MYPNEQELKAIESWSGTPRELIEYVGSLWEYRSGDDWVVRSGRESITRRKVYKVSFSTWGWSGNEDIVSSLEGSWFWMLFWKAHYRGGHYEFEIAPYWIDKKSPHGFGKIITGGGDASS